MRAIRFDGNTFDELDEWLEEDSVVYERIRRLIVECRRDPFKGIGKPEPLKGNLKGKWSRRITDKDRLIYSVTDDQLIIYSLRGHYDD